ncbi:MAG: mechanosensitive ion channel family protein [Gemmatimonadetes bacterium]|nr:mechanosensitive ion channel family protein [Gemmatimonadota bacterium]MCA9763948.1 mechanosensitive ion channel family protein [Gemmatimonadota bacterium]MCB9505565.1 mechanosensitive ion channel family protein [Gemmatimonadales bacterium]
MIAQLTPRLLPDLNATLTRFFDLFGIELEVARRYGVKIVLIWALAFVANQIVKLLARRIVAMADDGDDAILSHGEKRASTISGILRGVGGILVLVFATILTLDVFMDIGPILAGAGVIGLAVSFGSQSLVKDVISGFFLLIENQFDIGDVIEVAGLAGGVERMTLRITQLRDVEGVVHVIPNGQITTVSNKTRGWSRSVLDIGVGYGADVDEAIRVLRSEAERFGTDEAWQPKLDAAPEVWGVQALGDSSVSIRVVLRTIPGSQWEVGREFLRRAKRRLDEEGIEIPFPQRTVHVRYEGRPPEAGDAFGAAG